MTISPPVSGSTFAERICNAIRDELLANFGEIHFGVERLAVDDEPQSAIMFFRPQTSPEGGKRYALILGDTISRAVYEATRQHLAPTPPEETRTADGNDDK